MPRRAKPFSHYPPWILSIIQRLASGKEPIVQIKQPDKGIATSSAHMFNRGRQQFVAEALRPGSSESELRLAEIAQDIVARITNVGRPGMPGEYLLEFTLRGMAIFADESRGTRRGMPSPLRGDALQVPGLEGHEQEREAPQQYQMRGEHKLDRHDQQLADMLGIDLERVIHEGKARALSELPDIADPNCEHEPDIYGLMCVKCKRRLHEQSK